jgi:hypothetical protein
LGINVEGWEFGANSKVTRKGGLGNAPGEDLLEIKLVEEVAKIWSSRSDQELRWCKPENVLNIDEKCLFPDTPIRDHMNISGTLRVNILFREKNFFWKKKHTFTFCSSIACSLPGQSILQALQQLDVGAECQWNPHEDGCDSDSAFGSNTEQRRSTPQRWQRIKASSCKPQAR